jgi:hypothetical protein
LRDALNGIHAFDHAAEGGELAVECGLRRDAHEKLRAIAASFAGNADARDDVALVFQIARFAGQQIHAACAPEISGRFRILEQRVAALDDAVGNHHMEGAAIVIALAGEADELLDVAGGLVRGESQAEGSKLSRDHGFEPAGRGLRRLGPGSGHRGKDQGEQEWEAHRDLW